MSMSSRDILRSLSAEEKRSLTRRTNWHGLLHLFCHVAVAILLGVAVAYSSGLMQGTAMLCLGIVLVFFFPAMHEASHHTAFSSRWLNHSVTHLVGLLLFLPPRWFTLFHLAHHQHTHDKDRDPELSGGKPQTSAQYLVTMTGLPVWKAQITALLVNAAGRNCDEYVPDAQKAPIRYEARFMILIYGLILALSFFTQSLAALTFWLVPILLGQPALRAYLLAEHTGCEHSSDMMINSRTVLTSWPVRMLAWNMPFHAEHHCFPAIPFHRLPQFHQFSRQHIRNLSPGYTTFHKQYLSEIKRAPMQQKLKLR